MNVFLFIKIDYRAFVVDISSSRRVILPFILHGRQEVWSTDDMGENAPDPPPTFFQRFGVVLILAGVSLFCIISSLILLVKSVQTSEPIRFTKEETASPSGRLITVDIEGEVARPGVYALPEGSRLEDLLQRSGGLSENADSQWAAKTLNRASILSDGAKFYIPKIGASALSGSQPSVKGASENQLISINTASAKELDSLSGVGEVTSAKIMENRPYQRLEELVEKKIVKPSVFEKIKAQLTL